MNEIYINPTIIGAILAALIGSFSAWLFTYFTEKYRNNKRINGIHTLIKSEIEINLNNLKEFENRFLKLSLKEAYATFTLEDINYFYKSLTNFPHLNHRNWDELTGFIPDIFDEKIIKEIIQFNVYLDKLNEQCKNSSIKEIKGTDLNAPISIFDGYVYSEIFGDYAYFKNTVSITIKKGDWILKHVNK